MTQKKWITGFMGLALLGLLFNNSNAMDLFAFLKNNKAPVRLVGACSNGMPHQYAVVKTTITIKRENQQPGALGIDPIITHAMLGNGLIKKGQESALIFDTTLQVPSNEINLKDNLYQIPEIATKIASVADPRAGAVVGVAAGAIEIGAQIASETLNTLFGVQDTTLGIIDFFPTKYYSYNESKRAIELTPDFFNDLPAYVELRKNTANMAKQFNEVNHKYADMRTTFYRTYHDYVPVPGTNYAKSKQDYDNIIQFYQDNVMPALNKILEPLLNLEQMGLYRISIMAVNDESGSSCKNGWRGPFKLFINFFLGNKKTNTFEIDYCVKKQTAVQAVRISLERNKIQKQPFQYISGGIRLYGVDANGKPIGLEDIYKSSIAFPGIFNGKEGMYTTTKIITWADSAIVSSDDEFGEGLTQYLFAYDLNNLKRDIQQKKQEKRDAASQNALKAADSLISTFSNFAHSKEGQKTLLSPEGSDKSSATASFLSSVTPLISAIPGLKGLAKKVIPDESKAANTPSEQDQKPADTPELEL